MKKVFQNIDFNHQKNRVNFKEYITKYIILIFILSTLAWLFRLIIPTLATLFLFQITGGFNLDIYIWIFVGCFFSSVVLFYQTYIYMLFLHNEYIFNLTYVLKEKNFIFLYCLIISYIQCYLITIPYMKNNNIDYNIANDTILTISHLFNTYPQSITFSFIFHLWGLILLNQISKKDKKS